MTPSERERRILPADYESFWERRYNEQHRTLHSCEDALREARAAARELAEAARDVIKVWHDPPRVDSPTDLDSAIDELAIAFARHPSFSGEEGIEQ